MTADKRSVATDALETLGMHPIPDNSGRDAIHLAVEPVIAASCLFPGQHVGLVNGEASADAPEKIGIVDPFVTGTVLPGTRFWLVIYPRKITSLRHVWSHPAFDDQPAPAITADGRKASEKWLRDFAMTAGPSYETLIAAAIEGGDGWDEEYLHFSGSDAHGEIPEEFWDHVEIVTGKKPPNRPKWFSCSC